MRLIHIKILVVLLTGTILVGCSKKTPKTEAEKISYAIGQQIGQNIKAQNIEVETAVLCQALTDAITGEESRLTPAEIQASMQLMQKNRFEKKKTESKDNKEKGDKFLADNKVKEGVKSTKSGLQYKVMKQGKGKKPKAKSKVKVHYAGRLIDGTEFDSSKKREQPAEFQSMV